MFTNALYLIIFAVTVHPLVSFFKTCRGSSGSEELPMSAAKRRAEAA